MEGTTSKRNVQQHFVTASYLAGFTPEGSRDSQLYVYERNREDLFRAIPDKVAKRRNYYSVPKRDGGVDDRTDKRLTALEAQAMPVLRKLLSGVYEISTFERALIAYLIAFQEFRTPWARANFQEMEIGVRKQLLRTPGVLEHAVKEVESENDLCGSVSADEIRSAMKDGRIKLVAKRHAGIDTMVSTSEAIGNIYAQMLWTILRSKQKEFVTSDAPVVRRNPDFKGGLFGGGLFASKAQVWFPLSKSVCLVIRHDARKMRRFDELLDEGKTSEAEALRAAMPPIQEAEVPVTLVDAINAQTIVKADRFVYSPFESEDIPRLFKGGSRNLRVSFS